MSGSAPPRVTRILSGAFGDLAPRLQMGQKLLAQQDVFGASQQSSGRGMCVGQALSAQVLVEHQVGDILVELRQVVDYQQPVARAP